MIRILTLNVNAGFDVTRRRFQLPALRDAVQSVDPIIRRHDGSRIEAGRVHQPKPQLALRPARAGPFEVGRQVALETLLGERT